MKHGLKFKNYKFAKSFPGTPVVLHVCDVIMGNSKWLHLTRGVVKRLTH